MLQHRLADALSQRAHDLAVDQERVDGVAAVIDCDESFEPNTAGLPIHAHDRNAGAEAEGGQILAKEDGRFEAGTLVGRKPHPTMSEFGNAVPSDHSLRHALHVKAAAHGLQIFRARLEELRREPLSLLPHGDRGLGERAAAEARAAAAERPDRLGRAQRVAVPDDHVLVGDAEMIGDDLGERRLVALAVRARSRDRGDLAGPLHAHDAALPAEHVGGFDVGRDADAHEVAALTLLRLLASQLCVVGQLEGSIERSRVVS